MNVTDQSLDKPALDRGLQISRLGLPSAHAFHLPHSDSSHRFEKLLGNMANIVANSPAHHVYSGVTGGLPVILEKSLSSLLLPERWKLSKEAEMPWKINIHRPKTCPVGDHHCLQCSHAFVAQTETSIWYILVHDGYLDMFPIFSWFHSFHRVSKLQGALEIPKLNNPSIGQVENQKSRGGNWAAHHHTVCQQFRLTWKPGFLDSSSDTEPSSGSLAGLPDGLPYVQFLSIFISENFNATNKHMAGMLTSCVTSCKLHNCSEPQFPFL